MSEFEAEVDPELARELDVDPALAAAVLEIEAPMEAGGWVQPRRLFGLVPTGQLVEGGPALSGAPRNATARCDSATCQVLSMHRDDFRRLMDRSTAVQRDMQRLGEGRAR